MKIVQSIILITMLSACSVKMAAEKRGIEVEEIMECHNRACIAALGDTEVVETYTNEDGTKRILYKSLMPQGSTGRAIMHGLLDVATLGIWEVAGTPIEGHMNEDGYLVYSVTYDEADVVQTIEISGAS